MASVNTSPTLFPHQQVLRLIVSLSATTLNPEKFTLSVANFTDDELIYTDGFASPLSLQPLCWKKQEASCKGVWAGDGKKRFNYKHFLNHKRPIFSIASVGFSTQKASDVC